MDVKTSGFNQESNLERKVSDYVFYGVDLGSRSVKIAVMEAGYNGESGRILRLEKVDTIKFYREFGRKQDGKLVVDFVSLGLDLHGGRPAFDRDKNEPCKNGNAGLSYSEAQSPDETHKITFGRTSILVSTGYGRNTLELAGGEAIPELKAHVLGAVYQTGLKDFTLVDLGGQDSKIIQVRRGKMQDFLTNDKCAASSGRYLENMAHVLGMSLEELGMYVEEPVELNSTCAVFGESELIGKIVEGVSLPRLAAGVNATIIKRILPLLRDYPGETLVFTGGVAYNDAVRRLLAAGTGREVIVPPEPQFNGAIGCCIHGIQKSEVSSQKQGAGY